MLWSHPLSKAGRSVTSALIAVGLSAACAAAWAQAPATTGDTPPPPPPHHRGPPPEALAACESSAAGAACAFAMGPHNVAGTCGAPPGLPLACMPNDRPPPPPPGPPPAQ